MKINAKTANRLGIFFFYDQDGIVDRYVTYLLKDLLKSLNKLVIVCNGKLTPEGRTEFNHYADELIVRENEGLDVWAYKTALEYIGWDELRTYDEVILANSTIMGPIYPFKEMFDAMAERDLDFWGITKYHKVNADPFGCCAYGYVPEHIQSHFTVYRNSFLKANELKTYWEKMPEIDSYEKSVGYHESAFTKRFADKGFTWDVYVDTTEYEDRTDYPLMFYTKDLIVTKRCPIFKRRSFFHPYDYLLRNTTGQSVIELYDFLKKEQYYDVNLIWDNLLRTCHQSDFVRNLNLSYILSTQNYHEKGIATILKKRKIALIMHLYFEDLIEDSYQWASAIPPEADVYITTNTEKKKQAIEAGFSKLDCSHFEVRVIENRGRDVSSLLVGVADIIENYDYLCFVHDKKTTQLLPASVGESFAYKCFSNTLYNRAFVYNVLTTFEENPRLGILSPPAPNHADFFPLIGQEWGKNYLNTKQLAEKLNIAVPMDETKPPIAPFGTFFWFRSSALKPLLKKEWDYSDFPKEPNKNDGTILHAIERLYPFSAQQAGYYPALLMSDYFARIEYTNLTYYLRNFTSIATQNNISNYHENMIKTMQKYLDSQSSYSSHLESLVQELYPKTSLKWQLKDRFLRLLHLKR